MAMRFDDFTGLNRRQLLKGIGASTLTTTGCLGPSAWAAPVFQLYPFSLGVASGDPAPDGFVIWTKIAPRPLDPDGGMPKRAIEVDWAVAADERMLKVLQRGTVTARPELGHAVHVEVGGLQPSREYFYQFTAGGERSLTGRAKTAPSAGSNSSEIRFGVAGCQRYEDGYFTAFRHLAGERLDFVYHYGDYIYEYRAVAQAERAIPVVRDMPGQPDETYTLTDYRHRYALHKMDLDLQAAHASAPFVMSFDDHEVDNNWAGDVAWDKAPPELFRLRRAAAFQAWYEHMPVRRAQLPRGPEIQLYRRIEIGDLLTLNVLDTRQYRSSQPCSGGIKPNCPETADPSRTVLGSDQEQWLYDSFKENRTRWSVLAQQVIMMRNDRDPNPNVFAPSMDKWDGSTAARDRLFSAIEAARLSNVVVLTGDIHNNWAGELKRDFADERSATVGVEFVATSITSGGDGFDTDARSRALLSQDPHIKFYNNQRGYVRHVVRPDRWQADFQVVDRVTMRDGKASTRRSFTLENGRPGLSDT
jgi:alkaline phosphatase D